jgi:hypothetical protein
MDLSAAHLHLLINHVPTVGFIIGLGLFIIGVVMRSDHLKVASLATLVGIAIVTIPVYVTGSAAQNQICGDLQQAEPCTDANLSRPLIEMHEGAAFLSLYAMLLTGGFAWLGLWYHKCFSRLPTWITVLILLLSFSTLATVTRAATLGGEIRHPEIRVTQESTEPPLGRAIATLIRDTPWGWPGLETLHMIGLTLLMGVVLLIDFKMLGLLPGVTYATLDRLLPWAILGFGLNAMTGMLFFVGATYQYVGNIAFNWKMVFLLAAALNTLLFTFDQGWTRDGRPAHGQAKALAVTALVLWIGVMFWGSMLPFIGQAF